MISSIAADFSAKNELQGSTSASSEQDRVIKAIWGDNVQQLVIDSSKSENQKPDFKVTIGTSSHKPFPLTALVAALQQLHQSGQMQGVVLISKGQELIYHNAAGSAYANSSASLDIHSQFSIGSVSKQFTAAALLRALYAKNPSLDLLKAALHTPISHYLPKNHLIWARQMPSWADQITLHQLLTHTSGIPDFTEEEKFQSQFYRERHTANEVMALIKNQDLQFQPGTELHYSNTNYFLLAEIVTAISKQPFDQFLSLHFFQPLSMAATHQPTAGNFKELQTKDPFHHLVDPLETTSNIDLSLAQGCGGIVSTAGDLMKWNVALHITHTVLPKEVYSLMVTDYTSELEEDDDDAEGYGFGIENNPYGTLYGHQGRLDTFNSLLVFAPQDQISVIMLTNSDQGAESIEDAINDIFDPETAD